MADNIATINGQKSFTYLDAPPWHGFGPRLQLKGLPVTARLDAAIDAAQLRWTVGSLPIYLADGTEVQGHKASVRFADNGTVAAQLGIVGVNHTHTQNLENIDILRPLVEEFGYLPATAGALGNGERCFVLLRAGDAQATPIPGDSVNGYFLLHWGHDGQASVNGLPTTVRVVCQNTLALATSRGRNLFSIRHTSSAPQRLDQAARLVKNLTAALAKTGETFATMARTRLSAKQVAAFIDAAIPNTSSSATVAPVVVKRRATVAQLVLNGRGAVIANQAADTAKGEATVWGVLNAVTEYFDHVRTAEAQSPAGLRKAQESAIFGGNADLKVEALRLAQELVKVQVAA